jgi:hypothetical protein
MGAFISILDNSGSFINAKEFGGANFADYHGAYTDAANNIYISGAFETTVYLDPLGMLTQSITAMDFRDNYLFKLKPAFASVLEIESKDPALFPNPVSDVAALIVHSKQIGETYVICDQTGRSVMTGMIPSEKVSLDVAGLSQGIYLLSLNGSEPLRFVKN